MSIWTRSCLSPASRKRSFTRSILGCAIALFSFVACGFKTESDPAPLADRIKDVVACPEFEDELYDGIYSYLLAGRNLPRLTVVRDAFEKTLADSRYASMSKHDHNLALEMLTDLYQMIAIETPRELAEDPRSSASVLEAIGGLEMGNRLTEKKRAMQDRVRTQFDKIMVHLKKALPAVECGQPESPVPPSDTLGDDLLSHWKKSRHPAVYGGLKTMATAYQSCEAGDAPALIAATPDVKGIKVVGTHSNGVGLKRVIENVSTLIRSHPYLANYQRPHEQCFDVLSKPLIYDYGGKPFASTDRENQLDLFRDAGSGTSTLGIDCSGFVYTALATAGLKVKRTGRLKATGVFGVKAAMWRDPQNNGLSCFNLIQFNHERSLAAGDVLASAGHVILIENVGHDPFGISGFSKEAECRLDNMTINRFDFTILQSSPTKSGIGIDKMRAADYLTEKTDMRQALLEHAVSACLAKVKGEVVVAKSRHASLVRHAGTDECRDQPLKLAGEECLMTCKAN